MPLGTDTDVTSLSVAVLGGTGDQGRGLARRLAAVGNPVIIGSRSAQRAVAAADGLGGGPRIRGMANEEAARAADVVIVAVPYEGHRELLVSLAETLAGKIVIDCVNPLAFDSRGCYPLVVPEGSAAEQAAAVLPGSVVVGAFHHVSAVLLLDPEVAAVDLDVLVLGDDRSATDLTAALAARIPGVRGVYAWPAQLPAGGGADREPGLDQPPLQGPRRAAHHRHLGAHHRSTGCWPRSSSCPPWRCRAYGWSRPASSGAAGDRAGQVGVCGDGRAAGRGAWPGRARAARSRAPALAADLPGRPLLLWRPPRIMAALPGCNMVLPIEDVANDEDKTMLIGNGHTPAPLQRDGLRTRRAFHAASIEGRPVMPNSGRCPNAYSCVA